MLVDGFDLVLDLKKSKGCQIHNAKTGEKMLDLFSFFGTAPLGSNPTQLMEPSFLKKMGELAVHNPSNSDVYTQEMAEFVDTFGKYAVPSNFHHLFFIAGGALAVENALKTAFDWKVRKNLQQQKSEKGSKIIHFKEAFHGRSGYTLSMTNTFVLDKTRYFPKFNWPRVTNPKNRFPLTRENIEHVKKLEQQAVEEIRQAIQNNSDDIAGLIIEPIQAEGGDNHFRKEFFHSLRKICDDHEIMFILDEVQTGIGLTGKMWAYQHFSFEPDIIAFGKKTQVCGIMAGRRVDEIKDNVFNVPSRLNSTWGGNLIDMVRCQKYLEVIHEDHLVENAAKKGEDLLKGLLELSEKHPTKLSNVRGRGLMCAFDLPSTEMRNEFKNRLYKENVIILGCGEKSIRFRPPLIISSDEINQACKIIDAQVQKL
jgi:L-lysine 6-transaminase